MKLDSMLPFRTAALGLALLVAAVAQPDVYNIYQSNGACFDQCRDNYAFAVVQYQDCWCSNYIPANQQSVSNCNQNCPGYPQDQCGNLSEGLYGYIALPNNKPSGTAGAASSTTTSSTSTQPTPSTTSSSSSPSSSSSSPPSSSSTTIPVVIPVPATSEAQSSSATPTPVTSVRVVTVSGAIVTQTVTSTPIVAPGDGSSNLSLQRKGLSGGAIAGIVIGSLLGAAALLFGAFLLWRRRRRDGDDEGAGTGAGVLSRHNSPRRTTSVLSKTGLLGRTTSMTERDYDEPLYVNTGTGSNSVRHSMLFGAGAAVDGVSPVSPLGSAHDESRRHSRPLVYDQRLNPSALFANAEANGSRVSMQDQQDYSRPLGIANPDTRASLESRAT